MEKDAAKEDLKKGYVLLGLEFLEENADGLFFSNADLKYVVAKDDIEGYADFQERKKDFEQLPSSCSICSASYREHILAPTEPYVVIPLYPRDRIISFGTRSSGKTCAEISPMSGDFFNFYRFDKDYVASYVRDYLKRGMFFGPVRYGKIKDAIDVRHASQRNLRTIKVYNLSKRTSQEAAKESSKIIEDCLFQLSYLKNVPLWLVEEWPHKRLSRVTARFRFGQGFQGWDLPLKARFNSDIIRFYQLGMSTRVPELKFLSFYQILEYFYVSVSNGRLYEKLANQMKDPRFAVSEEKIDHLVQEVKKHQSETDETAMLKNVLTKFVDEVELIDFIESYEKHLGQNVYTKKHDVFGTEIEIPLREGHVIGNVSRQIKEIRNALVHSTDRYERNIRHVPFTETTKLIEQDIPLIRFLAEKVIISSAISYE